VLISPEIRQSFRFTETSALDIGLPLRRLNTFAVRLRYETAFARLEKNQ
jgi:hypothetical protein